MKPCVVLLAVVLVMCAGALVMAADDAPAGTKHPSIVVTVDSDDTTTVVRRRLVIAVPVRVGVGVRGVVCGVVKATVCAPVRIIQAVQDRKPVRKAVRAILKFPRCATCRCGCCDG